MSSLMAESGLMLAEELRAEAVNEHHRRTAEADEGAEREREQADYFLV
ncbi:MAG: hypothetical protein ABIZ05_16800 [Pseudonocardiaceae bacterium]